MFLYLHYELKCKSIYNEFELSSNTPEHIPSQWSRKRQALCKYSTSLYLSISLSDLLVQSQLHQQDQRKTHLHICTTQTSLCFTPSVFLPPSLRPCQPACLTLSASADQLRLYWEHHGSGQVIGRPDWGYYPPDSENPHQQTGQLLKSFKTKSLIRRALHTFLNSGI